MGGGAGYCRNCRINDDPCASQGRAGGCPSKVNAARGLAEAALVRACLDPVNWRLAPMGGFLGVDAEAVRRAVADRGLSESVVRFLAAQFDDGAREGLAELRDAEKNDR